MVAWFARPWDETAQASAASGPAAMGPEQLAGWLVTLKAMGVIPREGRVVADAFGTLPIIWRRHHAIVLLDVTSKPVGPQVYRLRDMRAGFLLDQRGIETAVQRRIRDLLATYTDATTTTITPRDYHGVQVHRLTDTRLPGWAEVGWAFSDRWCVIGFGGGGIEQMLDTLAGRAPALAGEPWFAAAHARINGSAAGLELYADISGMRDRLEEQLRDRPAKVLTCVGLQAAEKLLWTLGTRGREVHSMITGLETGGREQTIVLAGVENADPAVVARIPAQASTFGIVRMPLGDVFRNLRQAYLESQSSGQRRSVHEAWARLESELGFDFEAGLLDQLGDHLVFHTWPRHPLGISVLCTVWFQTKGDQQLIIRTLDGTMQALQRAIAPRNYADPTSSRPAPLGLLQPRLIRDPQGIWYLQLGLVGPAIGTTDGWIVISFSPAAVRQNLEYLRTSK